MKITIFYSFCILAIAMKVLLPRTIAPIDFKFKNTYQEVFPHKIPKEVIVSSILSLKNWMLEEFQEFKVIGLKPENLLIAKNQRINVDKYGSASSYSVKLDGDFPTGIQKNYIVLISENKREGSLFPLETLIPGKINTNGAKYIGGVMPIRGKDFYINYTFSKNLFVLSMNTLDFCDTGIPVGIHTAECVEYEKDRLDIYYRDLNGDQVDDIIFRGVVEYYCKPRIDRDELQQKPMRRENILIEFLSDRKEGTGIRWQLKNISLCDKLPKN